MATIVTKNSSTASAVPTTSDLVQGELAVNVTDKRIFTENASTQIVELGTNPSVITTATATVTGTLTANGTFASSNAVITGGSINSTPIGATTPSTIVGSTITANTGFVGGLTGNVTGNLTGNVTGNVTGDLTGDVTGNLTAGSGTTTLNNLVVNGTVDFNAAVLSDLGSPVVSTDAATKGYVDTAVSNVIDAAPAALDTLNELAAALGDDANFSSTVTTALATKLPLAGGTMTGAIAMGTSKITGLGDPTAAQDAATKTYVDTQDALKLNLTGGTMSGAIAMGTNKITGVGDPTLAQDAATKAYTDSILGSATSAADSAAAAATSASNAATSASDAATSATASANSATAAAASYDAFDDRYLGDKASDPTLDNDGNALLTGALYFNTTSDVMKVYDGSAWNIAAISSASPTFTGTVTADGLSLGDNEKATFGNSNDLEIYHDGSQSIIADVGAGPLVIKGGNNGNIYLENGNGETMLSAAGNGSVDLYYDNALKLATTATGIDVTGTVTSDDKIFIESGNPYIVINDTDITDLNTMIRTQSGVGYINTINDAYDTVAKRLGIDHATGDISFYENTGTTAKLFWNAGLERLGIGTATPSTTLGVEGNATIDGSLLFTGSTDRIRGGVNQPFSIDSRGNASGEGVKITHNSDAVALFDINGDISFYEDTGTTPKFFWDASAESLGIGTTSPTGLLHISSSAPSFYMTDTTNNTEGVISMDNAGSLIFNADLNNEASSSNIRFAVDGSEVMRINSSGNVGIGTTSPNYELTVVKTAANADIQITNTTVGTTASDGLVLTMATNGNATINNREAGGLLLNTNNTERLRIDGSGNVGIGTSSPSSDLHIASSLATIRLEDSDIAGGAAYSLITGSSAGNIAFSADPDNVRSSSDIRFNVDGSEAMRIDSSGNLLVGSTLLDQANNSNTANCGINLLESGIVSGSTNGTAVAYFNRLSSDGDIVSFRKDGTTVGSIGSNFGVDIHIGTGNTRLRFVDASDYIRPASSDGGSSDGLIDLATSNHRFKDLYLSGGVYLGGTGAANKLDDYEEGTFTVTPTFGTSGSATLDRNLLSYTKIGQVVYITGQIEFDVLSSPTGRLSINAPFAKKDPAGSDRETNSFFCGTFQSLDAAPPTGTDGDQLWFTIEDSEIQLFFYNGYTNTATEIDTTYLKTASRINITGWYLTT